MSHYVNNKEFYQTMIQYKNELAVTKKKKLPPPRISEYVGTCIFNIATRFATKHNFSRYSYKEEMISDGIENCIKYIHNFNPEKSNNPFSYFSQIISNAFIARIAKEEKQQYIKMKSMETYSHEEEFAGKNTPEFEKVRKDIIDSFELKKKNKLKKKPKKTKEGLSTFMDKSDE